MNFLTIFFFVALASDVALGRIQSRRKRKTCRIPIIDFPYGKYTIYTKTTRVDILNRPVPVGTRIRYTCTHPDFKLVGPRNIRCKSNGGWTPRGRPRCQAKGCQVPSLVQVENGKFFGGPKPDVGDWAKLICDAGYVAEDKGVIKCGRDGKWTPTPKCNKEDPAKDLKEVAQRMKEDFVDKFGLVTQDSRGRAGLSGGAAGLDLVFVLDNSRSVGKENFRKGKNFVKELIKSFGVSRHKLGTRVAVLSFHKETSVLLSLDDEAVNSTQAAMNKIDKEVHFMGGGTHTKTALRKVINDVVPTCRKKSKKALFLITDGESNTDEEPGDQAQQLRDKYNFECYAIGIGSGANEKELNSVASEPFRSHVFMLNNFDDLHELTQLIDGSKTDYKQCGIAGDTQTRLNKTVGRIVGGIPTKPGAWPWQAMILVDGRFRCSGSLLNEKWVVTAAHCFEGGVTAEQVDVRLGEHDRRVEEGPEMDEFVFKLIRNQNYTEGSLDFDIALLRLETPVKLTAFVRPVCLPSDDDRELSLPRKVGIVTGWGATGQVNGGEVAGPTVRVLNQVAVPFVHHGDCVRSSSPGLPITKNMICAGTAAGDVDACKGDSGGPLVARRSRDEWVLMGIVSWGEGCAQKGKYGVYTNVLRFKHWIDATMGSDI